MHRPQEKTKLPHLDFELPALHNCKKVNFCCLSHPSVVLYFGSYSKCNTGTLGTNSENHDIVRYLYLTILQHSLIYDHLKYYFICSYGNPIRYDIISIAFNMRSLGLECVTDLHQSRTLLSCSGGGLIPRLSAQVPSYQHSVLVYVSSNFL